MMKIILISLFLSIPSLANTASPASLEAPPKWPYGRRLVVAPFAAVNFGTAVAAKHEFGALFGVSAGYYLSEQFGIGLAVHLNPRHLSYRSTSGSALFVEIPVGVTYRTQGDLFSKTSVNILKYGMSVAIPTENYTGNITTISKTYLSFAMEASTLYPVNDSLAIGAIFVVKYGLTQPVEAKSPDLRPVDFSLGLQAAF